MKTKSLVLSLTLFFASLALVNAKPTLKPGKSLTNKVKSELAKSGIDFTKYDGEKVEVRFMINHDNEIIVLSTNNKDLDEVVKNSLNYDVVDDTELEPFQVYIVPVTLKNVGV